MDCYVTHGPDAEEGDSALTTHALRLVSHLTHSPVFASLTQLGSFGEDIVAKDETSTVSHRDHAVTTTPASSRVVSSSDPNQRHVARGQAEEAIGTDFEAQRHAFAPKPPQAKELKGRHQVRRDGSVSRAAKAKAKQMDASQSAVDADPCAPTHLHQPTRNPAGSARPERDDPGAAGGHTPGARHRGPAAPLRTRRPGGAASPWQRRSEGVITVGL